MSEITDDQLEELKDGFCLFDELNDEHIKDGDVIKLLQGLGLNPLTVDIKKVLTDSELAGKRIDFPTFVSIYEQFAKRPCLANHADLVEMFKTFDRDGNGKIFGGEFRQVLNNLGDTMTEAEIKFFMDPQEDADGFVVYEKLITFVMSA